jgi:hypothetical protein
MQLRSIALLAFLVPLNLSWAKAQSASAPNAPSAARGDDASGKEAEKRRILHLNSGQTIRVVSRWANDRWEYKGKSGWKALEPNQVASVALESDVLKDFRAMRASANLKKADDRVKLASWAATAGLMNEALEDLDAALAIQPDHNGALEVLHSHWFFTVPSVAVEAQQLDAAEDDIFRFGASMSASGRELAAIELAHHPDRARLKERVVKELRSSVVTRRAFASLALRRIFPGEAVKPLIMHAVLDPSDEVRQGCAYALKATNEPGVCAPIVKVMMTSKSPILRMNAAEALGNMGFVAAVEPLVTRLAAVTAAGSDANRLPHSNIFIGRQVAYIQDFDVQVAQFQAVADPQVNVLIEGQVTDAAVSGDIEYQYVTDEQQGLRRSLEKLTNEMPGHYAKDWLAWWDKNGSKWRSEDLSRPKTGDSAEPAK